MDSVFLNYIAEICRARRIPYISASTVDAWRAASATIDRIHGSEEARRAALVVATILDPDVSDVRALFGDAVAALVGVLAPRPAWDHNSRAAQWARIASQGDTAGQAAIALLAAECSTAVEKRDKEVLRGFLDILEAHASAPASVRDEARQLRDQINRGAGSCSDSAAKGPHFNVNRHGRVDGSKNADACVGCE